MTQEQLNNISKDIERAIPDIARKNGVYEDEVRSILVDKYVDEDDFIVIQWPEIQELMDKEGFDANCHLANDEFSLDKYGSSAYFVNKKWLNESISTSN